MLKKIAVVVGMVVGMSACGVAEAQTVEVSLAAGTASENGNPTLTGQFGVDLTGWLEGAVHATRFSGEDVRYGGGARFRKSLAFVTLTADHTGEVRYGAGLAQKQATASLTYGKSGWLMSLGHRFGW